MKYFFEKKQQLKFEIKDTDKDKPTKSMGFFETTMGKIMGAHQQILEVKLSDGGKDAGIILRAVSKAEMAPAQPVP